mmetsp:Transcript_15023/g.23793  ORF Transcript_15023/g.23793 Transcript_15023/m.23793 type:complete len:204 (+) Transcript_15023:581-1192(+)
MALVRLTMLECSSGWMVVGVGWSDVLELEFCFWWMMRALLMACRCNRCLFFREYTLAAHRCVSRSLGAYFWSCCTILVAASRGLGSAASFFPSGIDSFNLCFSCDSCELEFWSLALLLWRLFSLFLSASFLASSRFFALAANRFWRFLSALRSFAVRGFVLCSPKVLDFFVCVEVDRLSYISTYVETISKPAFLKNLCPLRVS